MPYCSLHASRLPSRTPLPFLVARNASSSSFYLLLILPVSARSCLCLVLSCLVAFLPCFAIGRVGRGRDRLDGACGGPRRRRCLRGRGREHGRGELIYSSEALSAFVPGHLVRPARRGPHMMKPIESNVFESSVRICYNAITMFRPPPERERKDGWEGRKRNRSRVMSSLAVLVVCPV